MKDRTTAAGRSMSGNYEKQVYIARDLFLKYDQEKMIRKFNLDHDKEYLYVKMLDRNYRIERSSGTIDVRTEDTEAGYEACIDYEVVMTICDILCLSKDDAALSGEYCPTSSLQITSSPGTDSFTGKAAKAFSGRVEELNEACRKIGGTHQAVPASADACYQIPVFSFFPMIFQFWDGDDEFEPKIMLLWDRKALDFMHFETLYYVMNHFLSRLMRIMDRNRTAEEE